MANINFQSSFLSKIKEKEDKDNLKAKEIKYDLIPSSKNTLKKDEALHINDQKGASINFSTYANINNNDSKLGLLNNKQGLNLMTSTKNAGKDSKNDFFDFLKNVPADSNRGQIDKALSTNLIKVEKKNNPELLKSNSNQNQNSGRSMSSSNSNINSSKESKIQQRQSQFETKKKTLSKKGTKEPQTNKSYQEDDEKEMKKNKKNDQSNNSMEKELSQNRLNEENLDAQSNNSEQIIEKQSDLQVICMLSIKRYNYLVSLLFLSSSLSSQNAVH